MNGVNQNPIGQTPNNKPAAQGKKGNLVWLWVLIVVLILVGIYFFWMKIDLDKINSSEIQGTVPLGTLPTSEQPPLPSIDLGVNDINSTITKEINDLNSQISNIGLGNLDAELQSIDQEINP